MTEKQEYWLVDPEGDYALVKGAEERDRLRVDGWAEAEEPAGDGFVHVWHEGIEQPGRIPLEAYRETWSHRGWVPGPPPGGSHPVPGGSVAETAAPPEAPVVPAVKSSDTAAKPTTGQTAAGGDEKGK